MARRLALHLLQGDVGHYDVRCLWIESAIGKLEAHEERIENKLSKRSGKVDTINM